jgi:SPP1 family predicted phage head-tail adaptor
VIKIRGPKTTLTLERKTKTRDTAGGYTETWTEVKTIKGVLCNVSGDERLSADKLQVLSTHNFYLDYQSGITEEDKFTLGARTFKINYINNIGANQNKALRINLLEEV